MFVLNRLGVVRLWPCPLLVIAISWSGIHAMIVGVLTASLIPIRRSPGPPDALAPPLHRLEYALQPWVAYLIVPVFGFANAGVSLAGVSMATLLSPPPLGMAAGQFVGK